MRCLRASTLDIGSGYNKSDTSTGNLVRQTKTLIPETREAAMTIQKDIRVIMNVWPEDIKKDTDIVRAEFRAWCTAAKGTTQTQMMTPRLNGRNPRSERWSLRGIAERGESKSAWDASNKQLVSLERHAEDEILKGLPRDQIGEETYIPHQRGRDIERDSCLVQNADTRPPCCTNCNRTKGHELLIPGQLHLATS